MPQCPAWAWHITGTRKVPPNLSQDLVRRTNPLENGPFTLMFRPCSSWISKSCSFSGGSLTPKLREQAVGGDSREGPCFHWDHQESESHAPTYDPGVKSSLSLLRKS